MDQTYHALRVFNIQYDLDSQNRNLQFEIDMQSKLKAFIAKKLAFLISNNIGFELDQIYTHPHGCVMEDYNMDIFKTLQRDEMADIYPTLSYYVSISD